MVQSLDAVVIPGLGFRISAEGIPARPCSTLVGSRKGFCFKVKV